MTITIEELEVWSRIGVPDAERASAQRLLVTVSMDVPVPDADTLDRTIDYAAVADWVRGVAGAGERRLIETLARELGEGLCSRFGVARAGVEIRKFILPATRWVAVRFECDSGV
jgi:dihydroneopterin aldolase